MHPNPLYRNTDHDHTLAYARERSFGMLTINAAIGPIAAHIPFILSKDETTLDAHIMRSNPLWRAIETAQPALLAITGPDAYVSPDWYGMENQVPTWAYTAVHLRGTLSRLPQEDLLDILDRLSDQFESRLAPKPVWKTDKMPDDVMARFMRMIVPIRMMIESVDSTHKHLQNKPEFARHGAADGINASPIGVANADIATHIHNIKDPT